MQKKSNLPPTVLDIAGDQKTKETKSKFLHSWTPEQFTAMERAIKKHFANKEIKTLHGIYPALFRTFEALGEIMGFAYTSTGDYAGYWVCNTSVYNSKYPGYDYTGFAIDTDGKFWAVLWDKEENEIIIPL